MNKQEHEALRLCVESLDQLMPYLAKVPTDVGLLNDALMAARPLLKQEPAPAQGEQSPEQMLSREEIENIARKVHGDCTRLPGATYQHAAEAAVMCTLERIARPAQTEQQPAYVECRECTDCGHVGINDAHQTDATCAMCDWSGPSPVEDQCPDCGKENAMGAACPKCSGRYRILAETHVAAPIAQTAPQHPDDAAVDRFAAAMKAKLAKSRTKGRGGWDDPNVCSVEFLAQLLVEHLGKGNAGTFEDVANFAMMLHQRGADPMVLAEAAEAPIKKARGEALELGVRALESKSEHTEPAPAQDEREAKAWPALAGIGRDSGHPRAVVLYLRHEPSDEHLRMIQEALRTRPAQTEQEIIGVDRYRVEPTGRGFWPFCVRAGSGERELFIGHRKTCEQVAAELATAFEDGKFVAALPAQTEQQPGQSEELAWKVLEAATDALDRRAAPHAWIFQAWGAGSEVITSRRGRTEPWPAS